MILYAVNRLQCCLGDSETCTHAWQNFTVEAHLQQPAECPATGSEAQTGMEKQSC